VPTLDFEGVATPRPRKNLRLLLGVGTIAIVVGISSTLAGSITLNGEDNVEFGQGVVTAAACDSNITITPSSFFDNSSDANYLMNSIRVSSIDLTPEGWDLSLLTPALHEHFNPNSDPELRSWDSGFEQYAGKYKKSDDSWANTCEGKVLQLRAYTNQSDYAQYTVSGASTDSPLWLNRTPSGGNFRVAPTSANAGVGIRFYYLPASLTEADPAFVTDLFLNAGGISGVESNFDALYVESEWGVAYPDPTQAAVTIYFDDAYNLVPLDSRWVNKVTIESSDKKSTEWDITYDWFGQLSD
jgi:hypothetical protein